MKKLLILICSLFMFNLFATEFDIEKFSHPEKYNWKNFEEQRQYRADLFERQKLLQIYDLHAQDHVKNILKSALLPGLGHFSARHYTKGQILLGIEVALLSTGYYFYDQAMENYDRYKGAHTTYEIDQYYEDARSNFTFAQSIFGLYAVIWAYTIYDTIIVTEEYNQNLWKNIEKDYNSKKVIITPTGFQLRF